LLAKFKVNPEYLRHAHLPEVLVSTKREAPTLAQLVAIPSNVPQTEMMMPKMMMPPPVKRQRQHINPETNKSYKSPFLPWYNSPKKQPRIPKTAAQLRLVQKSDSADRSPSRKPEVASGSSDRSPKPEDETEADKKRPRPSSTSSDQKSSQGTTSSGTGSGKTPGTGSRSNHGEVRKELFTEDKPSEAKEEAEKRRRNEAKETRDKEDRDNLKSNSGSSQNKKKNKKTKKKSRRSASRSKN
jgi:hypothetical protein